MAPGKKTVESWDASQFPSMRIQVSNNRNASVSHMTTQVTSGQRGTFNKLTKLLEDGKPKHIIVQFFDPQGAYHTTEIDNVKCAPNFPFRARKSTVATAGFITLRKGDCGVVRLAHPDKRTAYVSLLRTREQGYALLDALEIGTERENGDCIVEWTNINPDPQVGALPRQVATNRSRLEQTMKQILDTVCNDRQQLPNIGLWFWNLVETDQRRIIMVDSAVEGFKKAGTFELLRNGEFTLDQLVKKAPSASKAKLIEGVYTRLYTIVEKHKSSLYVGSSFDISARMTQHDNYLPTHRSAHSNAYNQAVKQDFSVLCDLSDNLYARQDSQVRLVVEQLLVILLGTYNTPAISSFVSKMAGQRSSKGELEATANSIAEIEEFNEDDPDKIDAVNDTSGNAGALSTYIRDRSAKTSLALAKIGREVCKQCGWQPTTGRKASNGRFGTIISPLNWASPIDSIANRPPITKIETSEMTVYRKAPSKVVQATGCLRVGDIGSLVTHGHDHQYFTTAPSSDLLVGSMVRLVFEVTRNGSPHPHAYARLPKGYSWNDRDRAMTLGIRAEWQDASGTTKTVWLMTSHKSGFYLEQPNGILHSHGLVIGVLDHLENREIVQNKRAPIRHFRQALMYEISFDHVRHVIQIEQRTALPHKVNDDAGFRSIASINQALTAAGAQNLGYTAGGRMKGFGARTSCDRCHAVTQYFMKVKELGKIYTAISGRWRACTKGAGDACTNCEIFGHECSLTSDVLKKPDLLQVLWFPPLATNEIFELDDPETDQLASRLGQSHSRQGSTSSQRMQSPSHSRQNSLGSPKQQGHSRGSSLGSPTSGSGGHSRASTGNPPRLNIPTPQLRWAKPSGSTRKDAFKNTQLYAEENHFKGELPPAVRGLANGEWAALPANRIAADTYPLYHGWVIARNQFGGNSAQEKAARKLVNDAFLKLQAIYNLVGTKNLLDAADALAQIVFKESNLDLWEINCPPDSAASPVAGIVRWVKPTGSLRKDGSSLRTDYSEKAFGANVSPSVKNYLWATRTADTLIMEVCSPAVSHMHAMKTGGSSLSKADRAGMWVDLINVFRDLGQLYKITRGRNLLDAGDWLAQEVQTKYGRDLWANNSEDKL
jgi:hypothetical protein